jgi:hypothetical protein
MRLRLGLLQDPAAIERQVARELKELNTRRATTVLSAPKVPTVKTEAQMKLDEERLKKEKEKLEEKARKLPRVRPLSEAKAIETGANFISETFLFCVAGALIGLEYWRSRRKETNRRDEVHERLEELESENSELKAQIIRIESALEGGGVKLGSTSEWLTLAKKNLSRDPKKDQVKEESTEDNMNTPSSKNTSIPQETGRSTETGSTTPKNTLKAVAKKS